MESIILFFEHLTSVQKLIWIVFCLSVFWLLEGVLPLRRLNYKKFKHAGPNLILLLSTIIINFLFGLILAGVFLWTSNNHFGIFQMISFPLWLQMILSLLFLDLVAQYFVHYLLHKVKFMWKLHMVHHSDTFVDVTTGTRHHPGDYIFREVFSLFAVLFGGIPFAFYMLYRILTVFFTYLTHANISLPIWLDKSIGYVFITPNMHKFHHHFERPWTDTNFGNIFSIWDRMFGTLSHGNQQDIRYGLDVLSDEKSSDLIYQLKVPFDQTIKTDY